MPELDTITYEEFEKGLNATFQLSVYAKLNVNEHLRCFVGYDFLFIGQISRAYNVIDYNESPTSGEEATGTRVRQDNSDLTEHLSFR